MGNSFDGEMDRTRTTAGGLCRNDQPDSHVRQCAGDDETTVVASADETTKSLHPTTVEHIDTVEAPLHVPRSAKSQFEETLQREHQDIERVDEGSDSGSNEIEGSSHSRSDEHTSELQSLMRISY